MVVLTGNQNKNNPFSGSITLHLPFCFLRAWLTYPAEAKSAFLYFSAHVIAPGVAEDPVETRSAFPRIRNVHITKGKRTRKTKVFEDFAQHTVLETLSWAPGACPELHHKIITKPALVLKKKRHTPNVPLQVPMDKIRFAPVGMNDARVLG